MASILVGKSKLHTDDSSGLDFDNRLIDIYFSPASLVGILETRFAFDEGMKGEWLHWLS